MRNAQILAVVLAVLLGVLVVGCGAPRPPRLTSAVVPAVVADAPPECCARCDDGQCCHAVSAPLTCPVGPVPPRKGRRS